MTGTITLPQDLPAGTEIDVQIGLSLSITAMRPPASPPPPPPPSLPAPTAYYKFDGNANATTGSNLTGNGGESYTPTKFGDGITGDFAQLENQAYITGSIASVVLSLSFWSYYGSYGNFIFFTEPDFSVTPLMVATNGSLFIGTNGYPVAGLGGDVIPYALTLNNGELKWYASGSLQNTYDISAETVAFANTQLLRINPGDGQLDDVALWVGHCLTEEEVAAIAAGTQTIAQLAGL